MGVQVVGADGQGGVSPALLIDTALFHKLLHLGRNSPVYKLPLAGACGGDDAVPVSDDGGEIRGPGQDIAELGRKILQTADKGILLKNNLAVTGGEDLQGVALADTHGAADLFGDHHAAKVV